MSSDCEFNQTLETLKPAEMSWQEYLIELVRCRPCLYDKYHPEYQDTRGVKKNAWDEIASGMKEAGFVLLNKSITGALIMCNNLLYSPNQYN